MEYRDLSVEYLGSDATERDLAEFLAAAQQYECAECGRGPAEAIARLWGNGDYSRRLSGGHCIYCHVDGPDAWTVPAVSDGTAWMALAVYHHPRCEWVTTRAHRVGVR